nr:GNAT family N-acetyltransferase [Streptomyces albus]
MRPTGPESRTADGRRSRSFALHVNSRPVGAVELVGRPEEGDGPAFGRIAHLYVEEGERRRGRGTVAVLAAEEVLRGWGCTHVEASVPVAGGENAPGAHLLPALGYTERSRHLVKELRTRPGLPPGSVPRPLTREEFEQWWDRGAATFIDGLTSRGFTREQAAARAETSRRTLLPEGAASPGAALRVLTRDGTHVGSLWLAFDPLPRDDVDAWVYDVVVEPERRGEGHGRSLMLVAELECLEAGARRLGLNVFAGNTRAGRLYTSLGYQEAERFYVKTLL